MGKNADLMEKLASHLGGSARRVVLNNTVVGRPQFYLCFAQQNSGELCDPQKNPGAETGVDPAQIQGRPRVQIQGQVWFYLQDADRWVEPAVSQGPDKSSQIQGCRSEVPGSKCGSRGEPKRQRYEVSPEPMCSCLNTCFILLT